MNLEAILDYYETVTAFNIEQFLTPGQELTIIGRLLEIISKAEELTPSMDKCLIGCTGESYDMLCDLNTYWDEVT